MKEKSSPRLKGFLYVGSYSYSITLCTHDRKPYLKQQELVSMIIEHLRNSTLKYGFNVIVYTFMPDHLHLLLEGREESDLKRFMKILKQMTGYYFKKQYGETLWHLSYYDHIIRKEEDILAAAKYILENPVRKGFVVDFREYPFSGSFMFNIKEMWL